MEERVWDPELVEEKGMQNLELTVRVLTAIAVVAQVSTTIPVGRAAIKRRNARTAWAP